MTLGKRVRQRRLELELTQQQVADSMGVSYPRISEIERGVSANHRIETIQSLAKILKTSVDWLLSGVKSG